jgi:phosphoribosylformylglycinamidine cyclo-ligase
VQEGDVVIGLPSNGLHTNGYTLARRIVFDHMGLRVGDEFPELERSVGEVLLDVHRSYLAPLWPLLEDDLLHGLAHITGGGIPGNLPRVLPEGLGATIDRTAWTPPPLFRVLQRAGGVDRDEMYRVFNMGVGMALVVAADRADTVMSRLAAAGEEPRVIGSITDGDGVTWSD